MHAHPPAGAKFEVAEVFRRFAAAYREHNDLSDQQARVLLDLEHCRTAALGRHPYQCEDCGSEVPLYNSCLNRHCPTCQGPAQYHWIHQRKRRLLNTHYFHVVFTLPAVFRPVMLAHRKLLLNLLFTSVADTLRAFGADPKWVGAELAFTLVLHTWTRQLLFHPHIHSIVTGGGLSFDGNRWISLPNDDFLFHVKALSAVFRGKFLDGYIELWRAGKIDLTEHQSRKLVRDSKKFAWNVYAKKPFGGPEQIINYLGRYTHRVAISSARMLSISDHQIVFRTRGKETCSLPPKEFIGRFLLHVLPHQFFKIRHYGLLAPGNVNTRLVRAQELLGPITADHPPESIDPPAGHATSETSATDDNQCEADSARPRCPHCGGRLVSVQPRTVRRTPRAPPPTQRPPPSLSMMVTAI